MFVNRTTLPTKPLASVDVADDRHISISDKMALESQLSLRLSNLTIALVSSGKGAKLIHGVNERAGTGCCRQSNYGHLLSISEPILFI